MDRIDSQPQHLLDADFGFALPLSLAKSGEDRAAEGYASTEDLDRQGEIVIQKGLDWSVYNDVGMWNDDHDRSVAVGVPIAPAEFHKGKGWFVRGKFLENARGDYFWTTAQALKKAGDVRKLALSIEGKALERDPKNPKIIRKGMVFNVAVTHNPINTGCKLDVLVKSGIFGEWQKALAATAGAGTSVAAAVPEDLEGSSASKRDSVKKLIDYLTRYYQATRGVTREAALKIVLDYVKRRVKA